MRRAWWRVALLALLLVAPGPAVAQKSEDRLRIAWRDALPDVDPYHNTLRTGLVIASHVWDTLIYRDPDTFQLRPLLATSWRYIDDTTLEFELRAGVRFHDGSPFTADDVVYTVRQALDAARVAVPSNYSFLEGAETIDPGHVRIKLKRVFPAALEYIATTLPILPAAYRTKAGDAFSQWPIGTGPYRVTYVGPDRIELDRNPGYFDGPKGHPSIGRISVDEVPDGAAELSALLEGRADWIWQSSPEALDAVARAPGLVVLRAESMRVGYINMDATGRTGVGNPLTLPAVRQAVAMSIDRGALARQFMPGGARVLDAPCYPSQFGCDQAAAVRYGYDPDRARKMLADAGFPDGFDTRLVGYLIPALQEAVAKYLQAVGIRADVSSLTTAEAVKLSGNGRNPLDSGSWGSYSINDASAFLLYFFTGGDEDYARDPEVVRLLAEASATTDADQRRRSYSAAIRRITEQAYMLPLFTFVTNYSMTRQLNFKPSPDELPRFYLSSWR